MVTTLCNLGYLYSTTIYFPLSFPPTDDTIVKTIPIHTDPLLKTTKNAVFCSRPLDGDETL